MGKKRLSVEQIIQKLREAELELARGHTVPQVVKKIGVTEQTYYRWRKEYGGLRTDQAKRFKELEQEKARLGSYKPNAFGLYDLTGNVWQWCDAEYYGKSRVDDPSAFPQASVRVDRGGIRRDRTSRAWELRLLRQLTTLARRCR